MDSSRAGVVRTPRRGGGGDARGCWGCLRVVPRSAAAGSGEPRGFFHAPVVVILLRARRSRRGGGVFAWGFVRGRGAAWAHVAARLAKESTPHGATPRDAKFKRRRCFFQIDAAACLVRVRSSCARKRQQKRGCGCSPRARGGPPPRGQVGIRNQTVRRARRASAATPTSHPQPFGSGLSQMAERSATKLAHRPAAVDHHQRAVQPFRFCFLRAPLLLRARAYDFGVCAAAGFSNARIRRRRLSHR